ncbi:MAG TPA: hypothetical protein VH542_00270 [Steroidobacteraceae bacterium]
MFSRSMPKTILPAAASSTLLVLLALVSCDVLAARPAREHPPRGVSSSHTERQRTENGHTTETTWTGANGKTATRDAAVVNDKAAGTRTRDVSCTGPNGKASTVHEVIQKTDDGHTRTSTATNAQGKTATRNAVVTNDKHNGTRTRDVTYTGVNGNTATVDSVVTRTDTGYTRSSTAAGPNGNGETRVKTVACDKSIGNCTIDVVNSNRR